MKKLRNLLLAFVLVAAAAVILPAKAEAATTATYKYSDDAVRVYWQAPTDLGSHAVISNYAIYDFTTAQYKATDIDPAATSCKVPGLGKGYIGQWRIECNYYNVYYDDNGNITSTYGPYTDYVTTLYVNTTPSTYSTKNFGISYASADNKTVTFQASRYNSSSYTGTQIKLYKGSTYKKTITIKYTTSDSISIATNAVYKYKARGFFTNPDTQKTYYGSWSSFNYFDLMSTKYSTTYGVRGAKLTLPKVSGVAKYVIYVSASSDTGYKKTMTVKVSGSKKTVSITKKGTSALKKGKYYYVKVIPYIKVGSSLKKSGTYGKFEFYNWK